MNIFQFLYEGVNIAYRAIAGSVLRSILTMLGVAVGILAITGIITLVSSMQSSITTNLSALGNRTLFVHNWPWKDNRDDWFKYISRPKVNYKDFSKLRQGLSDVEGVSFSVSSNNLIIKADGRQVENVTARGITKDYGDIYQLKLSGGRYFSEIENAAGSPVCIMGTNVAKGLFPNQSAIGQSAVLRGKRMKVIGILQEKGESLFGGSSEDDQIFIPYRYSARVFNLQRRSVDKVITVKAVKYERLPWVESEITGIMRASRGLKPSAEDNFSINKQEMIMKQIESVFGGLRIGGIIISFFSILVGGFGIGNIMYISVKERTHEIGVQKALGATRAFILFQFLAEAIMICVAGGLMGLGFLYLLTIGIQYIIDANNIAMTVAISLSEVFAGIGLSVIVGLVSGIIPSWFASSVDPVIAIRQK